MPFRASLAPTCEALIASLPEWFGIPEANALYLRNLEALPSWVALRREELVGAITLEEHFAGSFEVHFMAVPPRFHRQGIGGALLNHVETEARNRGGRWLHAKTLAASHPDPFHVRTRAFYLASGFNPLFESSALWGPANPAVVFVKAL